VVVFVKDLEGRYLLVNRRWEELFGHARADVLGKTSHDAFGAGKADALRANDLKALAAEGPLEFEEVLPHAEGSHTFLSCKFPLRDAAGAPYAVCGVSTDITGRKRAEQALRDSEALYQSLVEALPVQLFRKDLAGRFTFANGPFCRWLGRTRRQVLGRCDEDLYPEGRARKYAGDDRRVLETGEVLEEIEEQPGPEGEAQYVQVLKAPVRDGAGRTVGTQGILWDVTARKVAEEELARTAVELRVARRIQQKLFPAEAPRVPGLDIGSASFPFDIGGASYPAEAIGGDYFDYLALAGGCLGVAIGDVSGHGIGPALLMAIARAYLRASAQGQADVGAILGQVNRLLAGDVEGDRFITLLFARLDPKARTLSYASAGHTAGYVLDHAGSVKHSLESTGIPLGVEPDAAFPCGPPVPLDPGDMVLLLTDGVVETRDPQGAPFGARRALDLARVYRKATARQVVDNLYHAVRAFAQNMPQYDDITATVIKVGGPA
jgi:PAS domain S-box-containing protein